ncbi:MAG: SBBP repeat-containing protein, partial [Bacteroidia bacterium]|nr:SBBP repeat-containing protein [Bacteroidia bacterium]
AYITGYTLSLNFDVTTGAFQTIHGGIGYNDVFVTKLNASGNQLLYSTFIGGSDRDDGYDIVIDNSGNAYVVGATWSNNYDVTPTAYQTTNNGSIDVFVTKLNPQGNQLLYSTYIGGSGREFGYGIAIDASGNAYITGATESTNYDLAGTPFQSTNGGFWDVFVTKLNPQGSQLVYSTYIGGSDLDYGQSIVVDGNGVTYITGHTFSSNYDVTSGAFQTSHAGWNDVFVTRLSASGSTLLYSTYIGGPNNDFGLDIALDASGRAYVTGNAGVCYPTTAGAFQVTIEGGIDIFITKLCFSSGCGISCNVCNSCSPLSVAHLKAHGVRRGRLVELYWELNSSLKPIKYLIARLKGGAAELISEVVGQETRYADETCGEGSCTYQVWCYLEDGREIRSNAVVVEAADEGYIPIYPVGVGGKIKIERAGTYEIWEVSGRLIGIWEVGEEGIWIDLPAGVYAIVERRTSRTYKVVVDW